MSRHQGGGSVDYRSPVVGAVRISTHHLRKTAVHHVTQHAVSAASQCGATCARVGPTGDGIPPAQEPPVVG